MLFYVRCPTCAMPIYNFDSYWKEHEELFNDKALTLKQKERRNAKLLKKYGYVDICCVSRILGYIPSYKIFKS